KHIPHGDDLEVQVVTDAAEVLRRVAKRRRNNVRTTIRIVVRRDTASPGGRRSSLHKAIVDVPVAGVVRGGKLLTRVTVGRGGAGIKNLQPVFGHHRAVGKVAWSARVGVQREVNVLSERAPSRGAVGKATPLIIAAWIREEVIIGEIERGVR